MEFNETSILVCIFFHMLHNFFKTDTSNFHVQLPFLRKTLYSEGLKLFSSINWVGLVEVVNQSQLQKDPCLSKSSFGHWSIARQYPTIPPNSSGLPMQSVKGISPVCSQFASSSHWIQGALQNSSSIWTQVSWKVHPKFASELRIMITNDTWYSLVFDNLFEEDLSNLLLNYIYWGAEMKVASLEKRSTTTKIVAMSPTFGKLWWNSLTRISQSSLERARIGAVHYSFECRLNSTHLATKPKYVS